MRNIFSKVEAALGRVRLWVGIRFPTRTEPNASAFYLIQLPPTRLLSGVPIVDNTEAVKSGVVKVLSGRRDPEPSTHFDPRMHLTLRDIPTYDMADRMPVSLVFSALSKMENAQR